MADATNHPFWTRLVQSLAGIIDLTESLMGPGNGEAKKAHALELVDRWYDASGIDIRGVPKPIERKIVRHIASGLIDALVDLLQPGQGPRR